MLESALIAFTTFFATVAPVDAAVVFAAITPALSEPERRRMAAKGVAVAATILLAIAVFGNEALGALGISLPALRIAGGILLLLMAIDMVFARHSGGISTTPEETAEAGAKSDVSVFPLATPLIAGPGTMGATILRIAEAHDSFAEWLAVMAALALVLAITLALLLVAGRVRTLLGVTGINVVTRVMGVLLAALATQFAIDGLKDSGLF